MLPLLLLLLLPLSMNLGAQWRQPFRAGVQVGMAAERSSYTWMEGEEASTTLDVDPQQNGFFGITLDFAVTSRLRWELGPHYGQRNVPITTLQRLAGVNFTLHQDPVDYLGIPLMLKCLPFNAGFILPYFGAGAEFGMNLSSLHVTIDEHRISEEPPYTSTISRTRNLNQLYGALLAEAGLDIQASNTWSVLLGVRYSHELTPLLDDPLLVWDTPHNWKVRFAVLYTFGEGL